jgi:general secretion pathway protein B
MSFILDALKKSETDRQRQNGPALFEVRMAPPKTGLPLWAIGLGGLLAVNLVIVAWVLLRKPSTPDTAANSATNTTQAGVQPPAGPPYSAPQGYGAQQGYPAPPQGYPQQAGYPPAAQGYGAPQGYAGGSQAYSGSQAPGQGYPPPQGYPQGQQGYPGQPPYSGASAAGGPPSGYPQGQPGPNTVPVGGNPPAGPVGQTAGMTAPPGQEGAPGAANGSSDAATQAEGGGEKLNPDDYAPAADPSPATPFGNRVTRGTTAGVPLYRDAAALPGVNIPQLRLDLHVFAAKPQDRFVMVNMHKLHEGDNTPEGVHVERITPEGAVLSKDGVQFLLPRD